MLHKFHGGLKLRHHKKESLDGGLHQLPLSDYLYLPLRNSRGEALESQVNIDDQVLKGQIIAINPKTGVNLHAPTSGKVISLETNHLPYFNSPQGQVIKIKVDHLDQIQDTDGDKNPEQYTRQELIESMRNSGLLGLGGGGFPTHIKYKSDKPIETLIVNAAECEPFISCDEQLIRSFPKEFIKGTLLFLKASGANQAIIALEDCLGGVKSLLDSVITELKIKNILVKKIPTIYPTGGEKQLIEVLTNKQVPSGGIPADLGLIVQNPGTIKSLYDAIYLSKPLTERIITVAGDTVENSQNYIVPLGTPIEHILKQTGCDLENVSKIIIGGPMMGFAMPHAQIGVDKTTNCILALSQSYSSNQIEEMPCIRCGECVEACPVELLPQQLHWYIQGQQFEKAKNHHLFDCIECGACSYVCPSQIPLVDYYKFAKAELNYLEFKKTKSDSSQVKFENRENRLIRLKKERAEKRKKTTKRTQNPEKVKKDLQATLDRVKLNVKNK